MEREEFFTGYCRQIDGSRMVCAVAQGDQLEEIDCCYPQCAYVAECTVAEKISQFLECK